MVDISLQTKNKQKEVIFINAWLLIYEYFIVIQNNIQISSVHLKCVYDFELQ